MAAVSLITCSWLLSSRAEELLEARIPSPGYSSLLPTRLSGLFDAEAWPCCMGHHDGMFVCVFVCVCVVVRGGGLGLANFLYKAVAASSTVREITCGTSADLCISLRKTYFPSGGAHFYLFSSSFWGFPLSKENCVQLKGAQQCSDRKQGGSNRCDKHHAYLVLCSMSVCTGLLFIPAGQSGKLWAIRVPAEVATRGGQGQEVKKLKNLGARGIGQPLLRLLP
jgi:hypothetical protein